MSQTANSIRPCTTHLIVNYCYYASAKHCTDVLHTRLLLTVGVHLSPVSTALSLVGDHVCFLLAHFHLLPCPNHFRLVCLTVRAIPTEERGGGGEHSHSYTVGPGLGSSGSYSGPRTRT